jgi:hypothetical protein
MKLIKDSSLIVNRIDDQFHYFIMSLQNFTTDINMANICIESICSYIENQIPFKNESITELNNYINKITDDIEQYNKFKELYDKLDEDINMLYLIQFTLKKIEHLNFKDKDFGEQKEELTERNNAFSIALKNYEQNIKILKALGILSN